VRTLVADEGVPMKVITERLTLIRLAYGEPPSPRGRLDSENPTFRMRILMEQKELRKRSQDLRRQMTKEERHLWYDFLKTYPVQFKRQYSVGMYIVDFYCFRAKLVIELDGSQHCDPVAAAYDNRRTKYLNSQECMCFAFPTWMSCVNLQVCAN